MPRTILAVILGLSCINPVNAQDVTSGSQRGLPFITNYMPRDYGADAQNWGIVQDDRGVMYFGNTRGVLEFDGVSWRLIRVPGNSGARWITKDVEGTVYVSAYGEFGYLQSGASGVVAYVSLLEHVPDSLRDFTDVFQIAVTSKFIYFRTDVTCSNGMGPKCRRSRRRRVSTSAPSSMTPTMFASGGSVSCAWRKTDPTSWIWKSVYNPKLIFVGTRNAVVALLEERSGSLRELGRVELPDGSNVVEFDRGDLWIGSFPNVYRITVPYVDDLPVMTEAIVKTYDESKGLLGG